MDFYKLPAGFAMALARNFNAMNVYAAMTEEQKGAIVENARHAESEQEMHQIVDNLVGNRMQ